MKRAECTGQRILIVTGGGPDAPLAQDILAGAGLAAEISDPFQNLPATTSDGLGALLITEDALTTEVAGPVLTLLASQAEWSDLPVIVLTSDGETASRSLELLGPGANVILLEKPIRSLTLLAAIQAALRARRRQYRERDLLIERDDQQVRLSSVMQEADAANRTKDRFLATLSHELRLPLTPVLLTLSAMADDPEMPAPLREQLDFMRGNVQLEARLIDDLLDLTRILRGKLSLEYEPVDVHAQIRHAIAICRSANSLSASVHLALDAKRHRTWGDRARIQQVFWNLLANAMKFTPAEGQISVRTWDDSGDALHIEVSDNGVGMEPDEIARIFGAFEQGRSVTRTFGGVGLGLAIARSLVELHQGKIRASSPGRNQGTTFTLTLPILEVGKIADEKKPPALLQRSLRVLVVEDHQPTLTTLTRLLQKEGHEVTSASRIQDAIEAAGTHCFDVLISDLGLPDGSGVELIRHLRSRSHFGPAIALSGLCMDEDIRASRAAGFDRHLVKPVDWQQLRATIAETLQRYISHQDSQGNPDEGEKEGEPQQRSIDGLTRSA